MLKRMQQMRDEDGFTLVELLIVIVILGILAAVVVFAVRGITDRGQVSACKTDKNTIAVAEEAYFAKNKTYADEGDLVTAGFMAEASSLHNATGGASSYSITAVAGQGC